MASVVNTSPLQGLRRIHDSTVLRWSEAGIGAAMTSVMSTSPLQGLWRMQIRDRTVLRLSEAGVRRNVQVGEIPTNAMMVVLRGRKVASTKGPQTRATKKHKK